MTPHNSSCNQTSAKDYPVNQLAVGAAISLVGKVIGRGLDFTKQIILARLLSVEGFGLYALIWNLLKVIAIFASMGLQNGVIQFAMPYRKSEESKFKDVLIRSLGLSLIASTALATLFWISTPWLAENVFEDPGFVSAARAFVLVLPLMVGLRVASSTTRISLRMEYAIYAEELLQSISALLIFILLFLGGWQLFGAIFATTLSFALGFLLSCYYLYQLFPATFRVKRQFAISNYTLLAYSVPTAFAGMFGVVVNRLDRLFIGYFLTATEVGLYQAAAQFSIVSAVVMEGFNSIFGPMIAELHHAGRQAELQDLFCVSTKWGLYVNIPVFLVIFFAPHSLIEGMFGTPYLLGVSSLLALSIGQFINITAGGVGRLLIMTGKQNIWLFSSVAMMTLAFILNVILIPTWGIVGAAVATSVAIGLLSVLGLVQVKYLLGMWPYDRRYLKGVAATGVTVAGLLLGRLFYQPEPLVDLLVTTTISCSLFFGTLLLIGLDEEDMNLLKQLQAKIVAKK